MLWKHIISHPLLQNTQIVLFLNKCDLLRSECASTRQRSLAHLYRLAKLAAGAKFSNSVVSYGQRPNDYESITTCACHYAGVMRCYKPLDSST